MAVTRARDRLPITLEIYQQDDCFCSSCSGVSILSPNEGDVSDGQEADQDGAADDAGVPGVVPVQERVPLS